jgi:hypothetical protein
MSLGPLVLGLLAGPFLWAPTPMQPAPIRITGAGSVLTAEQGGERHLIDLPRGVRVDIDNVELLSHERVGSDDILLLRVSGPSRRAANGAGYCGAGVESSVVWMRLRAWSVVRSMDARVESCVMSTTIARRFSWQGNIGTIVSELPGEPVRRRTLRYDRDKAAEGFAYCASASAAADPALKPC